MRNIGIVRSEQKNIVAAIYKFKHHFLWKSKIEAITENRL